MLSVTQMLANRGAVDFGSEDTRPIHHESSRNPDAKPHRINPLCTMRREDIVSRWEQVAFERTLTEIVQIRADGGESEGSLEEFVKRCYARRRKRERAEQNGDQLPCKNWRDAFRGPDGEIVDSHLLRTVTQIWNDSVKDWIVRDPRLAYLASPTAKCACFRCDPAGAAMLTAQGGFVDSFGPLVYKEID